MLRWFRDRTWAMRVPRRLKELSRPSPRRPSRWRRSWAARPGPASWPRGWAWASSDIIDALDVRANQTAGSLDGVDPVLGVSLAEQIGSADANLEKVEFQHALRPLLDALPERERTILTLRFFGEMTQTQIGQRLGISQMHVSRILARTLKQLRVALTAED